MDLRRLTWAGVEATSGAAHLLIDPLEDPAPLVGFLGAPHDRIVAPQIDRHTWAVVTHLHRDHCDPRVLERLAPGHVICHERIRAQLASDGIRATSVRLWQTLAAGAFSITPVPSHDWRGDDQVAWIVQADSCKIIHCGDTIWHGHWYEIARRNAPFDLAFLPINGVLARLDGFTPTEVPATLTPEQAVEAAVVLQADIACAIHHSLFHNPPHYVEQPDALARFRAAGRRRGVHTVAPAAGEPVLTVR